MYLLTSTQILGGRITSIHNICNSQIPYGIGTATAVRTGNELGAGNPLRAKRVAYTAIWITGIDEPSVF